MMKRILAALCLTALLLTSAALAENVTVVCSFYPLRVFAENVLRDVPDVSLQTLAPAGTGCLHDFQLLPGDLRALEGAKCLIINGAGMEDQFLPLLKKELSALPLVDCSAGITLIEVECPLHQGNSLLRAFQCFNFQFLRFIKQAQCQVTPDGGELRTDLCRTLPKPHGLIVLPFVVVQAPQQIRSLRVGVVELHHTLQRQDVFQPVGKTDG